MEIIEKRKHHRVDSAKAISFVCLGDNNQSLSQGMGRTLNVSESGILIETPAALATDQMLSIYIGIDEKQIRFKGKVVHGKSIKNVQHHYGIHFVKARKEEYHSFKSHLNTLRKKAGLITLPQKSGNVLSPPYITGPPVDYLYVVEEETYQRGEKIIEEGSFGSWIWVILEGSAEIVRKTAKGSIPVLQLGPGAIIGDLESILVRNYSRSTSVIARGPMQLGLLDAQRLFNEFSALTPDFKKIVLSLSHRFKRISDHAVKLIVANGSLFQKQEQMPFLDKASGKVTGLYAITKGHATVIRDTANRQIPLLNLYTGDVFGKLPFLEIGHEPHHARVLESKSLKKIPLNMYNLQKEHERLPEALQNLMGNVASYISAASKVVDRLYG